MGSSRPWVSLAVGSDGITLITISNPLVNALAPPLVAGLKGKYVEAMNLRDVKAIVLTGLILKRAAVTNAPRVIAVFMISKIKLNSFFQLLVVGSKRAKPFPEPYLKALEVLKLQDLMAIWLQVAKNCDVYSFGVVTLEVMMGEHLGELISSLPSLSVTAGIDILLKDVLDQRLDPPSGQLAEEVIFIMKIVLACCRSDPASRPDMRFIAQKISS